MLGPRIRTLLLSLALLAAACGDRSSAGGSGEFLALTYNVAGLPEGLSSSHPERFTPLIAPLLDGYDLVLLQESWQTPDPNPFAPTRVYHEILVAGADHPYKSVPAENPLGMDPRRPEALLADGLNTFSRFPFEPVIREAWLGCDISAADCLALKGFSVARTTFAEGVTIDVYDLHMEAGGTPHDEELRDEGLTQLLLFMASYSEGRAVIVGGDFNLHTDEEPDRGQFERFVAEGGLTDVCAELGCPDPGRIDKFVYRSGGGVVLSATSWRLETDVFVSEEGEPLSDHDPVAVRFAWRAE
jgi:endonuclease/exonuclease/phosphatase family metal-dependent hydrolase